MTHVEHALAKYLEVTRAYHEARVLQPENGTDLITLAARCKLAGEAWYRAEREAAATPPTPRR